MSDHNDPTDFDDVRPVEHHRPPEVEGPNRWIGPLLFLILVLTPIVILVVSNTDSVPVSWAGVSWEAPLWIVLAITFAAGAVVTRLFGWVWRTWRRRRRRMKIEIDELRRQAGR